jgi:hypothetical protein
MNFFRGAVGLKSKMQGFFLCQPQGSVWINQFFTSLD